MLVDHTMTRLNDMRLAGISEAHSWQREKPNIHKLSLDERFSMLVLTIGRQLGRLETCEGAEALLTTIMLQ